MLDSNRDDTSALDRTGPRAPAEENAINIENSLRKRLGGIRGNGNDGISRFRRKSLTRQAAQMNKMFRFALCAAFVLGLVQMSLAQSESPVIVFSEPGFQTADTPPVQTDQLTKLVPGARV